MREKGYHSDSDEGEERKGREDADGEEEELPRKQSSRKRKAEKAKQREKQKQAEQANEHAQHAQRDAERVEGDAEGAVDDAKEAEEDDEGNLGQGFADALQRILARSVDATNPILAKNKTGSNRIEKERERAKLARDKRMEKKAIAEKNHLSLNWENQNYEFESTLKKTARRGVVQLFNAIYKHQRMIRADEKPDEAEPLTKEKFFQLLKSSATTAESAAAEPTSKPKWAALADDYMMSGSALRDWKNDEPDEPEQASSSE